MKKSGENLKLRLISVFIAVILWLYIMNIQNPEIKREIQRVPVNIINLNCLEDYGLALDSKENFFINVKVRGKKDIVRKLSQSDVEVTADFKGFNNTGTANIPLKFNVLGVEGVQILEGKPNKIRVNIEKFIQIQKMVDVAIQGEKKSDAQYEVKSIRPNVVTVSGPQSLVDSIDSVKVFIDVTNKEKDISLVKKYRVFNKNNTDITDNKELVSDNQSIQVDIDYLKVKEVPVVPKLIGSPAKGYYVSAVNASPDKVVITAQPDRIDDISEIQTKKLDIGGLNSKVTKQLMLAVPSNIKINSDQNVQVTVDIQKKDKNR